MTYLFIASFKLHVLFAFLYFVFVCCCCALFCLFAARLFHRVHSKKRIKGPLIIFGEQKTSVLVALSVSIDYHSQVMRLVNDNREANGLVLAEELAKFIP